MQQFDSETEDGRAPYIETPVAQDDGRAPFLADDAQTPVGGDTARYRAMKMHIAMGEDSPGIDPLENAIATGREKQMRQAIANSMTSANRQKIADNITKLTTSGLPITPEIAQTATSLLQQVPTADPSVAYEEGFAEKYSRRSLELAAQYQHNLAKQALDENPDAALNDIHGNNRLLARREIIRTALEDIRSKYEAQSWGAWGWNLAKDLVPGVSGAETSPNWDPRNIFQAGSSMEREIQKFWSFKKLSEAKQWLDGRIAEIAKSNPNAALQYAQSMLEMTTNESTFMDVMGLLDVQGAGAIGLGIARRGLKGTTAVRKLLKDANKGIDPTTGEVDPINRVATTGDVETATGSKLARDILKRADPAFQAAEVHDQMRLITRVDLQAGVNTPALTRQRFNEVAPTLETQAVDLATAMTKGVFAERVPEELIGKQVQRAMEKVYAEHPSLNGNVADVKTVINPSTHTREIEVQIIGEDGLFVSGEAANRTALMDHGFDFQRVVIKEDPSEKLIEAARLRRQAKAAESEVGVTPPGAPPARPEPGVTNFQTSQGSSYVVHTDGTTTRTVKRPADAGEKPRSAKTVYLNDEQVNKLSPAAPVSRIVDNGDGTLSVATRAEGKTGKWQINPEKVPYSTAPEKGLMPLELWRKADSADKKIISQWIGKSPAYINHNIGNRIVDVIGSSEDDITELLDKLSKGASFVEGNKKAADTMAAELSKAVKMEIKQEGARYYISLTKPLEETHAGIREDLSTIQLNNKNPVNMPNMLLGAIRAAPDQLAGFQNNARNMVTHIPQEMMRTFTDIAKNIGSLRGKRFEELETVLERNRDAQTVVGGKVVNGMAFTNQQQLEREWLNITGHLPDSQQTLAYWSYHQLMAAEWGLRNFGVHRDLLRQGVEHMTFDVKITGKDTLGRNIVSDSHIFAPGRFEFDLPWSHTDNFGILVINQGVHEHFYKNSMPDKIKDMIKDLQKRGQLKTIQIANPTDQPFKELEGVGKGKTVNFVVTDSYRSKPLPMNLVDWNPGVHVIYPQKFLVKQPVMAVGELGKLRYYGDKTIGGFDTEAQANVFTKSIAGFQKLLFEKADDATLEAYARSNLPRTMQFWKDKFVGEKAYLDLEHPIGSIYTGKTFFDAHPELKPTGLVDEKHSEFNLFGAINMDFLANRDGPLQTIAREGTAEAPIWTMQNARRLDPFRSLTRGIVTAVDNMVINDAKYAAIEQWTAQYKHLFPDAEGAARNPFQAFYGYKPDQSLWNRPEIASAINTRERIIQFLGTATEFGKDMNWLQQKLLSSLGDKAAVYYNDHELRFLKDPLGFTKAWMFNFKFGFFNPAQFGVQAIGFSHVLGVGGPEAASRGMSGYVLGRALRMTDHEPTINRLANIASKMGWGTADNFKEAYSAMRSIGFDIIGREHTMNAQTFDPNIFKNGFNTALEWGRSFFTEGERVVRETAWYTAFYEWRKANPTKEIDNFVLGRILTRADNLSANMTKASHSRLQEGIFQPATQFYTFSQRMLEQFWGNRLTIDEKLRAFFTHSALFGLPITAAIGIPWPINDSLKQALMEDGSPLLHNGWYKAFTEGFLSWATHMVTGTEYNVEQRYGPGFSDYFKKLFGGEMGALEAIGGASGSFLSNLGKSLYPFYAHMKVGMFGGQEEFPLAKEDIMGILREISSVNNFHNAYYALNTGKYFSRNDSFVADGLNATDAAMMVLGLTRKDITDTRLMLGSLKDQKKAQDRVALMAEKEIKTAVTYMGDGDWKKAETHMARAKALMVAVGDFKDDLISQTLRRALGDDTPQVKKIQKDFTEKGYKSQLPDRFQRLFDGKQPQ